MKNLHRYRAFLTCFVLTAAAVALGAERQQPLWVFPVGATVQSSPAIGSDGTIYFGADNGIFYALTPAGKKKWEFVTSGAIVTTPAIASDGTVYVASIDRIVYALNPDGTEKWRLMPGSGLVSSPAIAPDGTIYVGSVFNKFFAISPDGFRKWDFPATGNIISSPAVDATGNVYFGCMDTNFYAVNTNGAAIWVFKSADRINSSPAIDSDGNIYFGGFDRSVYALSKDGKLLWEFKTEGAVRSSPIIDNDGTIYIGCDDGKLYAIDRSGKKKWEFATKDWVRSTPALSANGVIYFGSYDGGFYAVKTNGDLLWNYQTDGPVSSSPIISQQGVVYFGSWDKNFYAFKSDAPLAETPWAAFRKNLRRTGCVVQDAKLAVKPEKETAAVQPVAEIKFKPKQNIEEPAVVEPKPAVPAATIAKQQPVLPKPSEEKPQKQTARKTEKPILKITSPKNGTRFEDPKVVVEGSARHPDGLKVVEYRLNSGTIFQAKGLGKWSAEIRLNEGDNLFEVRATSATGEQSDWERLILRYSPACQIFLQVNGKGKVSPSVAGKKYESGQKIVITAEPQRGFAFSGWSGSFTETSPKLEFTITSNIILQANFAPVEKPEQTVKEQPVKKPAEKAKPSTPAEAVLNIEIKGKGTVSPYSGKTILKSDKVYKLVAKPESGFIFAGWNGDVESMENEIEINLKTNIAIVANFIPSPFYSKAGNYSGLISERPDENAASGLVQITVSDKGLWRARLNFSSESLSCEGKFDEKGDSYAAIKRGKKPPLAIVMKLTDESAVPAIHGRITGNGSETMFLAKLTAADSKMSINDGYYTAVFICETNQRSSVGDGFAQIRVDKSGNIYIEGKLGDGTPITATASLLADKFAPVFVSARNVTLDGWLVFTNSQTADLLGQLRWIRAEKNANEKLSLRVIGSAYIKPQKTQMVLSATNLVVAFSNGGLDSTIGNYARLDAGNKISILFSDVNLSLSIDPDTGLFKGSFVNPVNKKQTKYEGIILQKRGWGSGCFSCEGKSGLVFIAPELTGKESSNGR
ncbi:MAG: PQQ-binding-like beta-propeller repeat protein [Verrucomicrobiia bacterium]